MEIKIPKEFSLFGRTYQVEKSDSLFEKFNRYGDFSSVGMKIRLQSTGSVYDGENIEYIYIDQQTMEETYLHEVTHAILDTMSNPIGDDESFVSVFSKCLFQILTTGKFE